MKNGSFCYFCVLHGNVPTCRRPSNNQPTNRLNRIQPPQPNPRVYSSCIIRDLTGHSLFVQKPISNGDSIAAAATATFTATANYIKANNHVMKSLPPSNRDSSQALSFQHISPYQFHVVIIDISSYSHSRCESRSLQIIAAVY